MDTVGKVAYFIIIFLWPMKRDKIGKIPFFLRWGDKSIEEYPLRQYLIQFSLPFYKAFNEFIDSSCCQHHLFEIQILENHVYHTEETLVFVYLLAFSGQSGRSLWIFDVGQS